MWLSREGGRKLGCCWGSAAMQWRQLSVSKRRFEWCFGLKGDVGFRQGLKCISCYRRQSWSLSQAWSAPKAAAHRWLCRYAVAGLQHFCIESNFRRVESARCCFCHLWDCSVCYWASQRFSQLACFLSCALWAPGLFGIWSRLPLSLVWFELAPFSRWLELDVVLVSRCRACVTWIEWHFDESGTRYDASYSGRDPSFLTLSSFFPPLETAFQGG